MRFIQLFGNFFSSPSPHRVTGALLQLLHSGRPSDALDEILLSPPHQLVPRRRLDYWNFDRTRRVAEKQGSALR